MAASKVAAMLHLQRRTVATLLILILWTQCLPQANAYSVLTHEEIIDIAWKSDIEPLLLAKFPGLTNDQLKDAHAYAYGGSIIQDLGYYPHGSKEFSDLVHYVRSGDFVRALLKDSQNANEYAFAHGAVPPHRTDVRPDRRIQKQFEKILAEACASRTHQRRRKPTLNGFEDREDHRAPCASVTKKNNAWQQPPVLRLSR